MQLAHLKTSPVVVLGPLNLLEWQKETFAVDQRIFRIFFYLLFQGGTVISTETSRKQHHHSPTAPRCPAPPVPPLRSRRLWWH